MSWRGVLEERADEERSRASRERPPVRRRRVGICSATVVAAAGTLTWSLRIAPGDPLFYPATLALAGILLLGTHTAGRPLRPGIDEEMAGPAARLTTGVATGIVLLAVFLLGAVVVARVPVLREPVRTLLAHAGLGSLPLVLAITALNGVAEELFYRGALFDALAGRRPVLVCTLVHTAVTALSGIPLLALAALVVGLVCALMRRWTRGLLAAVACHLTWSVGMLLLLPPALDLLEAS